MLRADAGSSTRSRARCYASVQERLRNSLKRRDAAALDEDGVPVAQIGERGGSVVDAAHVQHPATVGRFGDGDDVDPEFARAGGDGGVLGGGVVAALLAAAATASPASALEAPPSRDPGETPRSGA